MKSDLRGNKDFLACLLFLAIGIGAIVVARDYPFGTAMRMGSDYFPTVLRGILVLFGAFLMARGARPGERGPVTWGWKPLACIAASMVLFGFLISRLGLVPALVALFFTAALGTPIGVLPGISPLVAIGIPFPLTFTLPAISSLIMLAGIYHGAQYGGSTTSILVNLPGETASAVTCLDGHQMARQGRAEPALAIAALANTNRKRFADQLDRFLTRL